ncbi:hypothetical protein K443DRAFT_169376 [Laccaria amethystina LaAM-08-1]|uniref:Uncharacterized protein n=1 Tax=Laccaria amethystina LaAM-08-1 TaxID=1095629 RepID=A0A0C9YBM0_9AGAR|nr:hypothetical protein K443DRAFT_169376 [Laccaria amethystina LaAM-08-1]
MFKIYAFKMLSRKRVKRFLWRSGTSSTHSWLGLELTRRILLKYVHTRNVQSPPYTAYSEERSSTDCGGDFLVISRVEPINTIIKRYSIWVCVT